MSEQTNNDQQPVLSALLEVMRTIADSLEGIRQELHALRAGQPGRPPDAVPVAAVAVEAPAKGRLPPAASPLVAALEQAGGARWVAEAGLRSAGGPAEEAIALSTLLAGLEPGPGDVPLLERVRDWARGNDAAAAAGLLLFSPEEGFDLGITPAFRLGDGPDRPGLQLGGKVLLEPAVSLKPSLAARLAVSLPRQPQEADPQLSWQEKLSLARGERLDDACLLRLLDWAERQPARRPEVLAALRPQGVRAVERPDQADPDVFLQVRVYRPMKPDVVEPAFVVEGDGGQRVLRQGRVRVHQAQPRPTPLEFMQSEQQTLVDDLRREMRGGREFCRLQENTAEPTNAEEAGSHLAQLIERYRRAEGLNSRRLRAEAFGQFVQEVRRVCPTPHEEPGEEWSSRQRDFLDTAQPLLDELGLKVAWARHGKPSQEYLKDYYDIGCPPRKNHSYNAGEVAEMRAPALRYPGGGQEEPFVLKGTLYFVR